MPKLEDADGVSSIQGKHDDDKLYLQEDVARKKSCRREDNGEEDGGWVPHDVDSDWIELLLLKSML